MISQENKDLLTELATTRYGTALLALLHEELDGLNDVTTVLSWDETLGRKESAKFLKRVFSFMGEKRLTEKTRNQYE